jgi:hypothetical protein
MLFDGGRLVERVWHTGLLGFLLVVLLSCTAEELKEDDASDDFLQRVEENILPEIVSESEDVLRNLLNFMPVFTEICATPFMDLGRFSSQLTALQQAEQGSDDRMRYIDDNDDNDDRTWQVTWRNVVFGADSTSRDFAPVDARLNARYLDENFFTIRPFPFDLTPSMSTPQTAGDPANMSFSAEGFYLFQDVQTGQWTLRWHTNMPKVFKGQLSDAEFRRVFRHASGTAEPDDIDISGSTREITFEDTTTPDQDKGFTFFVRPGDRIRFELEISESESDTPQGITTDQLFIGGTGERLPRSLDADDFELSSSLPIDPTGQPTFIPGVNRGMYIWQDLNNDQCQGTEDEWHVRFSAPDNTSFTGSIEVREDETDAAILRVTAVLGSCAPANFDGAREIDYSCTPTASENGYDLCTTGGQRLRFDPEVNGKEDPSVVFIGAASAAAPSESPFAIVFEIKIEENGSARELDIDDTTLVLRGNRDEDDNSIDIERAELINPDQLSLDPNCVRRLTNGVAVLPAVRVTGNGQYSTDRFDGSRFELDSTDPDDDSSLNDADFAFEENTESGLQAVGRFPDRGSIRLRTRGDTFSEEGKVTGPMTAITATNGRVTIPTKIELTLEDVDFRFRDQPLDLGIE